MGITEDMIEELSNFLAAKQTDPKLLAAERRLEASMRKLFNRVARAIDSKIKEPGGTGRAFELVKEFDNIEDQFATAIQTEIAKYKDLPRSAIEILKQSSFEASKKTLERIKGNVMELITEGYQQGKGPLAIARDLRSTFTKLKGFEAVRIARTEIGSAQGLETYVRHLDNPLVDYQQWITADDELVRGNKPSDTANHVVLHEEITRVGEPFSNGLRYPKDRNGPIEEWIQCRCVAVPFIMPKGYVAPPGKVQFFERDLVKVAA